MNNSKNIPVTTFLKEIENTIPGIDPGKVLQDLLKNRTSLKIQEVWSISKRYYIANQKNFK